MRSLDNEDLSLLVIANDSHRQTITSLVIEQITSQMAMNRAQIYFFLAPATNTCSLLT